MDYNKIKEYLDSQKQKVVEIYDFDKKKVKYSDKIKGWKIDKFRGDSTFSTWIYRITVNTAWTLRKKAKKHYSLNIEDTQEPIVIDEKNDPELIAINSDLSSVLRKALDQIPLEQRIIVELKNIEGRSHKEIAEYLDISVTAAKVRLHRAHQKLRTILEDVEA